MRRTAFYPGSFDPITNGHKDIIVQAGALCDKLVVSIGVHPGKTPMFSVDERAAMLRESCGAALEAARVELEVGTFADLTVQAMPTNSRTQWGARRRAPARRS